MEKRDADDRPPRENGRRPRRPISRRGFLAGIGGAAAVAGALTSGSCSRAADAGPKPLSGETQITLRVNGEDRKVTVEPRTTLLDALRDRLDVTGPKKVCDRGECGACTVLMDGQPVYACLTLAVDAQGKQITTVEGIGTPDKMHPVQQAFVEHDALMCGFCTPGFVMSVKALLDRNPNPSPDNVRHALAGNICRCGTYPRVFEAALDAAKRVKGGA